jgi:hypothetical protein
MADNDSIGTKQKVEQNDLNGQVLKSRKTDLLCGGMHQISVYRPSVIIDSHMHIQSGNCAPLPFMWERLSVLKYLKPPRWFIEGAGEYGGTFLDYILLKPVVGLAKKAIGATPDENGNFYRKSSFRQAVPISENPTLEIGKDFIIKKLGPVHEEFKRDEQYEGLSKLIFFSVVMTMDMEYAHIDGYYGIKVYNAIYADGDTTQDPIHYWYPAHGVWKRRADCYERLDIGKEGDTKRPNHVKEKFTEEELKRIKENGIVGLYHDVHTGTVEEMNIVAAPCLTDEEETKLYEQWTKQVKSTELLVLSNPLKLLPMFHYDPRRWQLKGNQEVYNHVGSDGLYLGYKIYTAQGYRPWDIRRLPILKDFYVNCCENQTPILNHCTPDGAYTFDRDEYFGFEHPNDNAEDLEQKYANGRKEQVREVGFYPFVKMDISHFNKLEYFNEQFGSPDAWRQVLDSTVDGTPLNTLRLCFAHFGGNTHLGREWGRQIMDMIQKYPNVYADISSSFADEDFRKYFLGILRKEAMEEKRGQGAPEKNGKALKTRLRDRILFGTDWYLTLLGGVDYVEYCQKSKKAMDDVDSSLWFRFTQYNPSVFYRLYEEIDRIAVNIINRRELKDVKDILGEIEQDTIDEIYRDAAYIRQSSNPYFIYKEWQ